MQHVIKWTTILYMECIYQTYQASTASGSGWCSRTNHHTVLRISRFVQLSVNNLCQFISSCEGFLLGPWKMMFIWGSQPMKVDSNYLNCKCRQSSVSYPQTPTGLFSCRESQLIKIWILEGMGLFLVPPQLILIVYAIESYNIPLKCNDLEFLVTDIKMDKFFFYFGLCVCKWKNIDIEGIE